MSGCNNDIPTKVEKVECELARECDERYKRLLSYSQYVHVPGNSGGSPALNIVKNRPKIFKPLTMSRSGFGSVARGISAVSSGS